MDRQAVQMHRRAAPEYERAAFVVAQILIHELRVGKVHGARVTIAPLDAANGFAISRALIEPHITPATRVLALINPCNPTGRVYTRDELQIIADIAQEHDLLVLSDEVYEEITYDDATHISIASLPGMKARTITMCAFTKA